MPLQISGPPTHAATARVGYPWILPTNEPIPPDLGARIDNYDWSAAGVAPGRGPRVLDGDVWLSGGRDALPPYLDLIVDVIERLAADYAAELSKSAEAQANAHHLAEKAREKGAAAASDWWNRRNQ